MSEPISSQNLNQDNLDRALVQTLITTGSILVACMIGFLILRRFMPRLYAPSLFEQGLKKKKMFGCWSWFRPIISASDDYIYRKRGFDAAIYFAFQRSMIMIIACFLLYGFIILWPVDGTATNKDLPRSNPRHVNGTAILTMANISTDSSTQDFKRFAAHLVSLIFNAVVCWVMLWRTYQIYYKYSKMHCQEPVHSNYTVLIDKVSPRLSESDLMEIFRENFGDDVLAVHRVPRAYQLHTKFLERLELYDEKDSANYDILAYEKKMMKKKNKKGQSLNTDSTNSDLSMSVDVENGKHSMEGRPLVRDVDTCYTFQCCCCCCAPKVDQLERVEAKLEESNKAMEKLEKRMKDTQAIFVSFKTRTAASKASQLIFSRKGVRWEPQIAPDWLDLRWQSFEYHHASRKIRYWIILIITFFIGITFFIPITFAQGLANLSTLSTIPGFKWLTDLIQRDPNLVSFIEGILPSLVLAIGKALVKVVIKKLVFFERYFTRSNEWRSFTSKYWYILILNILLASIAAGTFITLYESAEDLVSEPLSIVKLLAMRLPMQVNFFVNYVAVNSVLGSMIILLQPVRLIKRIIYKYACHAKTRRMRAWLKTSPWLHYHEEYAEQMLFFAITICYSTLAPLIVPFSLIYFCLKWFVHRYMVLYVCKKRFESFGKAWPSVFNRLIVGMVLHQALMTGIFSLNQYVPGIVISPIFAILTIIYSIVMNKWYRKDCRIHTIELHENFKKDDVMPVESILKNAYRDPLRDWRVLIDHEPTDVVHYHTRDYLKQLQLSLEQPGAAEDDQDTRTIHNLQDEDRVMQSDMNIPMGVVIEKGLRSSSNEDSSQSEDESVSTEEEKEEEEQVEEEDAELEEPKASKRTSQKRKKSKKQE